MEIIDISWRENKSLRCNNPLLPRSIRSVIVGESGCGMTMLLLNLLLTPDYLDYDHLYVFGKSLFQTEYKIIKKAFEVGLPKECVMNVFNVNEEIVKSDFNAEQVIEEMDKQAKVKSDISVEHFEESDNVPDPRDLNSGDSGKYRRKFDEFYIPERLRT